MNTPLAEQSRYPSCGPPCGNNTGTTQLFWLIDSESLLCEMVGNTGICRSMVAYALEPSWWTNSYYLVLSLLLRTNEKGSLCKWRGKLEASHLAGSFVWTLALTWKYNILEILLLAAHWWSPRWLVLQYDSLAHPRRCHLKTESSWFLNISLKKGKVRYRIKLCKHCIKKSSICKLNRINWILRLHTITTLLSTQNWFWAIVTHTDIKILRFLDLSCKIV